MPSIIPALPLRPTTVNFPSKIVFGPSYVVPVGTSLLATDLTLMFEANPYTTTQWTEFTNHGTIWSDPTLTTPALTFGVVAIVDRIINDGIIVVVVDNFPDYDYYNRQNAGGSSARESLTNSGQMFSIATNGTSLVFGSSTPGVTVTNSGLMAAQANNGIASAIDLHNGGTITNLAGGQILGEGIGGGTIRTNIQTTINNAGLIQAASVVPGVASTAIMHGAASWAPLTVNNSGTIRADIAIYSAYGLYLSTPDNAPDFINNLAGGVIEGTINLTRGNDVLDNAGTITGLVDLGEGNDTFDNRLGVHNGWALLGWNDDTYLGSSGFDQVGGGPGNDRIEGNAGNDLLLGDGNDDTLIGGAGNDALYGEYGNDLIVTSESDYVDGGDGNDRIELGDYRIAFAGGSYGFDTLVLPTTARTVDLGAVSASGRISGFEALEMRGTSSLVIRGGDFAGITSGLHSLQVLGTVSNSVVLVGGWSSIGNTTVSGQTFARYQLGDDTVLVASGLTVNISASAPGAATGLDAVQGSAAPVPGVNGHLSLDNNVQYLSGYSLSQSVHINPEETFWSDENGAQVMFCESTSYSIFNEGTVGRYSNSDLSVGRAISAQYIDTLRNTGTIETIWTWNGFVSPLQEEMAGFLEAVLVNNQGHLNNEGLIRVQTYHGLATGVSGNGLVNNIGTIGVESVHGLAVGLNGPQYLDNSGQIIAVGGQSAIGVDNPRMYYVGNDLGPSVNRGSILAQVTEGDADSIGVRLMVNYGTAFRNQGTITADIAIKADNYSIVGTSGIVLELENTGLLDGRVVLSNFNDHMINSGRVTGLTELGTGDDSYDGTGSTFAQNVDGGAGADTILGGSAADLLRGGDGNDVLDGRGGLDQLLGGLGDDLYRTDSQSELVVELANEGIDTVESSIGLYLYQNVENLVLTGNAGSFGVGNDLANTLTGNAGSNLMIGGLGNDTFYGAAGNDQLFGQDGADTLNGDAGIDYLVGGTGDDTLRGGADADALYGEDGNDYLDGGASFDTDILVGGAGNDTLYGISGQANPDYDLMDGGAGDDDYWVDTGADLTFEAIGGGTDTVHANVTVANAGVYLYANVENLVLEGTTAFGVGNELDNVLTGSASGNWLLGGLGADTINGAGGNDVLFGEGGADVFVFGANSGADLIGDFVRGSDRIQLGGIYADFAALQSHFVQNGADGAIDLGGGNLVVLRGVTMANLTAADFIFAPAAEAPAVADKTAAVMELPDWLTEPLLTDPADLGLQRWGDVMHGQGWTIA